MLAAVLLFAVQDLPASEPCPFDRVVPLEIVAADTLLEGHGPSKRVEYTSEFSGTLHVWTKVEGELDTFLRLEEADGKLIAEDDNTGGGRTPYAKLGVLPGRRLTVIVAAAAPEARGRLEICLMAAPESSQARAAAESAKSGLAQVQRLRESKGPAAARVLGLSTLQALLDEAGSVESELFAPSLWALSKETQALSLPELAGTLLSRVWKKRTRTLPDTHSDLQLVRLLYCRAARELRDLGTARALGEKLLAVYSRTLPSEHPNVQLARRSLAVTLSDIGDLQGSRALEEQVLEIALRTSPPDDSDLQVARLNLAVTLGRLGDPSGARVLKQQALDVYTRTLPPDHARLQMARVGLAATLDELGEPARAQELNRQVLEVRERTLPEEHPDLQLVRNNLALNLVKLGDLRGARELQERVLAVYERTVQDDDENLAKARRNLAGTLDSLGEFRAAVALREKALAQLERRLPEEHLDVQLVRSDLASTLQELGDLAGARALQEQVLQINLKRLPPDHPQVQVARVNLGVTLGFQGDFDRARALQQQAVEVYSRTLPPENLSLLLAQLDLAASIKGMGDLAAARALEEHVLATCSRTLPENHPTLQMARQNLGGTLYILGDLAGARVLFEQVLEVLARTLPDDHPNLQLVRQYLALTMRGLGEVAQARSLLERVLASYAHTLPEDHPNVLSARGNLAGTLHALGEFAAACDLEEQALAVCMRVLPEDHPHLQVARKNLAATNLMLLASARPERRNADPELVARRNRCAQVLAELCRTQARTARSAILSSSCREAEERCAGSAEALDTALSFAGGWGVTEPMPEIDREAFALSETARGAALATAALIRGAAGAPEYAGRRTALRQAREELAAAVRRGSSSDEFRRLVGRRDEIERGLLEWAREVPGAGAAALGVELPSFDGMVTERDAFVSLRRYRRTSLTPRVAAPGERATAYAESAVDSLCAMVLRRGTGPRIAVELTRIELGPIEPIERAVHAWRDSLQVGVGSRGIAAASSGAGELPSPSLGVALRRLVFDPLLPALGGAERVLVVSDDVLNLVPLDALPALDVVSDPSDARLLLGDRWRIELRATLAELLRPAGELARAGEFVGIGGVEYGAGPPAQAAEPNESRVARDDACAGILRGGAWGRGFEFLPQTQMEVRGIEALFSGRSGVPEAARLLSGGQATRAALFDSAPHARWLHVASHGWFAPESIRSWTDMEPLAAGGAGRTRLSSEQQVRGMSPMLLCGLALAGANLPEDALGRVPGLITAEEISTLELTNCELVVLSACDTNVGERRAGQGMHSLQMALQMAGARSVITSLWKVPDGATKELMLDFYRRLWVEKKPKWQALWEAKKKLREAKDESGKPKYTTRDWAAWVLTGDPD